MGDANDLIAARVAQVAVSAVDRKTRRVARMELAAAPLKTVKTLLQVAALSVDPNVQACMEMSARRSVKRAKVVGPLPLVSRSQTVLNNCSGMSGSAKTQGDADFVKFAANGELSEGKYKSRLRLPEVMAFGVHIHTTMGAVVVGKCKAMTVGAAFAGSFAPLARTAAFRTVDAIYLASVQAAHSQRVALGDESCRKIFATLTAVARGEVCPSSNQCRLDDARRDMLDALAWIRPFPRT